MVHKRELRGARAKLGLVGHAGPFGAGGRPFGVFSGHVSPDVQTYAGPAPPAQVKYPRLTPQNPNGREEQPPMPCTQWQ